VEISDTAKVSALTPQFHFHSGNCPTMEGSTPIRKSPETIPRYLAEITTAIPNHLQSMELLRSFTEITVNG